MVTAKQVQQAMTDAHITQVDHHECAGCGYMTAFIREGDDLFFDPGCDCRRGDDEPRSFQDAADWINMQSNETVRADLMRRFGLEP